MDGKQVFSSFVTTLFFLPMIKILPIDGQIICPWCDKKMESNLVNCVYIEMMSSPELFMMPLRDIDNIKWKLLSDSDSMSGMSYAAKKVAMDDKFVDTIAGAIKQNNYQRNPAIISVVSELAGNCYSSVTGYDPKDVIQDIKRLIKENIGKSSAPLRRDPNSASNPEKPYSTNSNQKSNFKPSHVNDAPFNPSGSPPVNSFNNPSGSPPVNSFNNPSYGNDAPFNPPGSPPVNSFNDPSYGNVPPLIPPGAPLVNSFNKPSYGNDVLFNPPGSSPVNSFNNPPFVNNVPFNTPASPLVNQPSNPAFVNNAAEPSENRPSNNYKEQGQAGLNFSKNQAPPGGSSSTLLQNDNESHSNQNMLNNSALATTSSPKSFSPSQDSKLSDSDSSDTSYTTTSSPHTDAPQKKSTGNEKSEDEEPCDEKFKIALYEKLINDYRFSRIFGKLPVSNTKLAVLEIMHHVFKEYGIQQHYEEFSTFWKFNSKTLNKESKTEDWDEVISKICKIVFSRNNLLKGDCEEIGIKIADYILDVLPGDPPASSTQTPNQNDGNGNTSTESNANSASNSTTDASLENNSNSGNSTNSSNLSFPELHSKLADMFKPDGSTVQNNSDDVPFSKTLSTFEAEQNLGTLQRAAESCLSPSGFDFKKFLSTMSNVTDSIQNNHPNWSRDKCEKEMYSETVAVMAELLQDTVKSSSNNVQSQSSPDQPDSVADSSSSQNSDSGAPSDVPNNYNLHSDDSTNSGPGTDFVSDSAPQPQQDFTNHRDYPDGPRPTNVLPYGNQPGPSDWNDGLTQPSNLAHLPVNTNYGNFANGNLQNAPSSPNQPYDSNYGLRDNGPVIQQPNPQNFPSQDYSAIPPDNINQPGPSDWNDGLTQPSNLAYRPVNTNYGNLANGNLQNTPSSPNQPYDSNYGLRDNGPVIQKQNPQNFPSQDYSAIPPDNINQPGPSDWNDGLTQPSNFAPRPVNTNYGNLANGNLQNIPSSPNQPYNSNHGLQDNGPVIQQPKPQNFPSQDYSAIPPDNINQPGRSDWNDGLTQPSNFAPRPVNTNNGNLANGNLQNTPSSPNQPYDSNYGSQDNGPVIQQPKPQNFPSQDYSAIPPDNMNTHPFSGNQPFPVNQNTGFQQSPNFVPNSGFMNSPNGNNRF